MLPPPLRRNPLCLFCAFAARSRPPPTRLVSRIQIAQRVTSSRSGKNTLHYNPLEHSNPVRLGGLKDALPPTRLVQQQLQQLQNEFRKPGFLESVNIAKEEFDREWLKFEEAINVQLKRNTTEIQTLARRGKATLLTQLRQQFYAQVYGERFTTAELENQKVVADLRYPAEWYPATREIRRTVHMHVGPTNSGKTYHALKRLEEAKSGIYLGPLRLLAHEVYTRLNAKGKPCALITGEEQRIPQGERIQMHSCTVEMVPLNTEFDVAVIDEIQMINHRERGWAWTQAFLGLQARELHLCGEARTVPLMRELCALVGDKFHVHEYNRLTPLKVQPHSLGGKLSRLEKGDCIVAFTILGIHALRRAIERKTGRKCAIVYGSLPPETRAQQARLFNDPDNEYDFLVASDAIGMGLNLAIKRVIFDSTFKSDGTKLTPLPISDIKQIAGRAGRYKTAHEAVSKDSKQVSVADTAIDPTIGLDDKVPDAEETKTSESNIVGWVTTLDSEDLGYVKRGMAREPEEIKTAGLFPPSLVVERFANYFPPGVPFGYILLRLHEISAIHPRFHLCRLKDQLEIADVIHAVKNLSVQDRIAICAAPINMRSAPERRFLQYLAECIADGKPGSLLDIECLPLSVMDQPPSGDREYLSDLERLHKMLVCYLWLSYRFPNVFSTRALANYTKKLVEDQIEKTLNEFSFTKQARMRQIDLRNKARERLQTDLEEPIDEIKVQQGQTADGLPNEAGTNEYADKPSTSELNSLSQEHIGEVAKL